MATRRKWSTGKRLAFGFAQGASNFLDGVMRDRLADRQAERIAARQEEADIRQAGQMDTAQRRATRLANQQTIAKELPKVASGETMPQGLMAMISALGEDGMFPSSFDVDYAGTGEPQREAVANAGATAQALEGLRPPMRRSLKPIGEAIDKAKAPEEVPDIQSIINQAQAADDRASQGGIPTEALIDPSEPESMIASMAPEVRDYVNQAMGKSQALRDKPGERLDITNPDGSKTVRTPTQAELAQGITVTPDAKTQGVLAGQTDVAKETESLNPAFQELKTRTLAKMANIAEGLTRQAKVDTIRATEQAKTDVRYDPANVEREIALERAKNPVTDKTTESERRAAANWMPLVNAHSNALLKEAEGVRLTPFAIEATSTPFYQAVFGGQVDKETQAYVQSARDFVSTLGYIRSGVAVRPDEVNTFIFTMFGYEGESPAQVAQKVQSREIMLGAMQAMVGRSAPEAARVLAEAVNNGQIPASLLSRLEIRPDISKALLPLLNGVPQYDINGNVIGVKPKP